MGSPTDRGTMALARVDDEQARGARRIQDPSGRLDGLASSNDTSLPSASPKPPGSTKSRCMSMTISAVAPGSKAKGYGSATTVGMASPGMRASANGMAALWLGALCGDDKSSAAHIGRFGQCACRAMRCGPARQHSWRGIRRRNNAGYVEQKYAKWRRSTCAQKGMST